MFCTHNLQRMFSVCWPLLLLFLGGNVFCHDFLANHVSYLYVWLWFYVHTQISLYLNVFQVLTHLSSQSQSIWKRKGQNKMSSKTEIFEKHCWVKEYTQYPIIRKGHIRNSAEFLGQFKKQALGRSNLRNASKNLRNTQCSDFQS